MANQKISEMPEADLPLSGDELVPIVQEGHNRIAPASAFGGGGDGIPTARGTVDQWGTVDQGSVGIDDVGWNCASPGAYVVNFVPGFFSATPIVVVTPVRTSGANLPICEIVSQTATEVEIQIYDVIDGTGRDCAFNIVAIQGAETE